MCEGESLRRYMLPAVRPWPTSLRARLSLAFLLPSVVFLAALIGLAFVAARAVLEDEVGERLRDTAAATAALMPTGLVARFRPGNERTHQNLLGRLRKVTEEVEVRRLFLATLDGISLVDTAPDAPAPGTPDRDLAQDRVELERVARGETAASVLYTALDGVRFKRGFAPIVHEGEVVAVLGVEGSAVDYAGLDAWRDWMVGLAGLALVALTALVLLFSRALTAPLRRLARAAARIGAGELEAPVRVPGGAAELTTLGRTMEEMRAALRQRDREMQMMLGGIAHEVRNPLGGMALFVGLLRDDLAGRDEELSLLARVEGELKVLGHIVEEFLEFARHKPADRAPVPLAGLAAEVAALVEVEVEVEGPPEAEVSADAEQLRRLLLNLARNAAQAGATRVRLVPNADGFDVVDDGPGMTAEVAAQAFDAFFTTREKGTGLGLALCRKIAEAHGGRLTLENPGEPGARVRVRLG